MIAVGTGTEKLRAWFLKSGFARDVTVLAGSAFIGQGLIALSTPLLSRLYTPADFGLAALFVSVVSILTVVAGLRYEVAIPLPADDESAANVFALAAAVVLGSATLVGLGAALLGNEAARWFRADDLGPFLWLLPLSVLGVGLYQVFSFWAVRRKEFAGIARSRMSQAVALVTTQASFGMLRLGPLGLLLGEVLGRAGGVGTLAAMTWRRDRTLSRHVNTSDMARAALRYRRFPLLSSGAALLNNLGVALPALVLAALYGPRVVGWFALAQRILAAPLNLVAASVNQVFVSEAARTADANLGELRRALAKALVGIMLVALPYIVVLVLAGPGVFRFVFGAEWAESGVYVRVLAVMCFVEAVATATGGTLDVLQRQDLHVAREIIRVVLLAGAGLFAWLIGAGSLGGLALLSAGGALAYVVYLVLSLYAINHPRPASTPSVPGSWL